MVVVPGAELLLKPLSVAINGGSPLGTDFVGEAVAECVAEKKPLGVSAYAGTLLVPIAARGSIVGVLRCADKSSSDSRVGHRFTKVDAAKKLGSGRILMGAWLLSGLQVLIDPTFLPGGPLLTWHDTEPFDDAVDPAPKPPEPEPEPPKRGKK